jgi:hypothetical protein
MDGRCVDGIEGVGLDVGEVVDAGAVEDPERWR